MMKMADALGRLGFVHKLILKIYGIERRNLGPITQMDYI